MKTKINNQRSKSKLPFIFISVTLLIVLLFFFIKAFFLSKKEFSAMRDQNLNLLIISLDTMRADRMGAYGYSAAQTPNLDQLALNGLMFENCYTPVPITLPAHCSIFTGKNPLGHRVRDNGTYFLSKDEITLAEKFKSIGYHTYAIIASYVLLSKFGLNQGFDLYDDSLKINEMIRDFDSELKADQVYSKFQQWFQKNINNRKTQGEKINFFTWIHFYDAHLPYNPPKEFQDQFPKSLEGQYDGEVAFIDFYIGKIIHLLKSSDQLKKTFIIIVGDHGEAFGEHQEFGHSIFCYEESLKVPLIFYNKHLFPKSKKIEQRVSLIDIMPTVMQLFDMTISQEIQGRSFVNLLNGKNEKKPRSFYIESMHGKEEMGWAPLTGIIHKKYKYISLPEPELYDLHTDPGEKDNLFWKKNRMAREIDKQLLSMVKKFSTPKKNSTSTSKRQLSENDRKHLQTLGYISAFENTNEKNTNLDPKKGMLIENRLNDIKNEINAGKLEAAEVKLFEMRQKSPDILLPQYFGLLISIYEKRNDLLQLINTWKQAIENYPQNNHFKINLAFQYFNMNQLEDAEKLALLIIKDNPSYTKAHILMGRIYEKKEQLHESLMSFKQAFLLEPHNVMLKISYAKMLGRNKKIQQAAEICEELLSDDSIAADPELRSRIGIVLAEIRKDKSAFPLLLSVVKTDQASAETWNYLGILYYRTKQFQKADEAYQKSLELDPNIAKTYNNMGTLYLTLFLQNKENKWYDLALKNFNKALELNPILISALNGRASAFKFGNQIQNAIKDWEKILNLQPDFIDAYFNLGITYLEINSKSSALKYFEILQDKFYQKLPEREKQRLNRLIDSAGG